ncbi:MAG: RNA 2',3'-cyclic phosphodiesterase [Calditrichaeota bacterium]|nr:MAG: RNA 2',3'-cyclic phosphodiesterase [Calditrichota bacterium]
MEKIRTFVAIAISPELQQAFGELLQAMRRIPGDVKWVAPESIHLTLKFLGELTPDEVHRVFQGVETAVANTPAFSLATAGQGAFPSLKNPRVFWIGLKESGDGRLIPLQKRIEEALQTQGFAPEKRRFKAHLTVGRVRRPRNLRAITEAFVKYPFPEITFPVKEVLVMKSRLTPQRAYYTIQKAFPLQNH